jgi:arginyl-tRNA synthetase
MNPIHHISSSLLTCIETLFPAQHARALSSIDITLNVDAQRQAFGDLSCNAALVLAREAGRPPREVAQVLVNTFRHEHVKKVEIAGPGFLNIWMTAEAFQQVLRAMRGAGDNFFRLPATAPARCYSVEFVSANPTGPLHIGHGRNGIIGDVLSRVLKFRGHNVTAEFYINDAGSQIQKLGNSLKIRCQQQLGLEGEIPEGGYHGDYLREIAAQCIQTYGADVVLTLSDDVLAHYAKNILLEEQKQTLGEYRIHFDRWFSELELYKNGDLEKSFALLEQGGHLYESEGALWLRSSALGDDKDRVVRKSSGEYTYVASDIAYLYNKLERGFEEIILVLGQDHHGYVGRLTATLKAFGRQPDMLKVILYQLVMLKNEGEALKLSKRAGRIVSLEDVIQLVGADVARFFFLHRKADAHLDFDLSLALKHTDENPVYYIQYAYVRTLSILQKAQAHAEFSVGIEGDNAHVLHDSEHLLIKKMAALDDVLAGMTLSCQTHTLTYYVLELAHLFHSYYAVQRVIVPENLAETRSRLVLIAQLRDTFALCLRLLGLATPATM